MLSKICQTILTSFCLYLGLSITHDAKSINTNFISYYNKFVDTSIQCGRKVNNSTLRIEMSNSIKPEWIAVCHYYNNIIRVNEKTWKRLSKIERDQLMFHELGHCLLSERHNDKDLNIMNSVGFVNKKDYTKYYDYFIRRLFKDCRKPLNEKFEYEEVK